MGKDIEIKMLEREYPESGMGQIITKEVVLEILKELTENEPQTN